jgi:tRNA-dihydrouridine synthase
MTKRKDKYIAKLEVWVAFEAPTSKVLRDGTTEQPTDPAKQALTAEVVRALDSAGVHAVTVHYRKGEKES